MTYDERTDAATMVDALLQRHGLDPARADRDWLVGAYPLLAQLASHPRIPEIRYAELALIYPVTVAR
jgi:hypothetical protein